MKLTKRDESVWGQVDLHLHPALVGYSLEGNVFSWQVFKERFRLHSFPGKAWLWIVGGIVVSIAGIGLLAFTTEWLASLPALAPPSWYPDTQIWTNGWIRSQSSLFPCSRSRSM